MVRYLFFYYQDLLLNNILYLPENIRIGYFNSFLTSNYDYYCNSYDDDDEAKIKIDRFKANEFYEKFNQNSEKIPDVELNQTIFGQVFQKFGHREAKDFLLKKNERLF